MLNSINMRSHLKIPNMRFHGKGSKQLIGGISIFTLLRAAPKKAKNFTPKTLDLGFHSSQAGHPVAPIRAWLLFQALRRATATSINEHASLLAKCMTTSYPGFISVRGSGMPQR